jgi:hypothetical protein
MADDMIRRLVGEQRKRLIAGLMNAVEASPWYAKLSAAEREAYRREVLTRVGTYHDFMLDVIKVADDDTMVNGHALEMIERVHASQLRIERSTREVARGT